MKEKDNVISNKIMSLKDRINIFDNNAKQNN